MGGNVIVFPADPKRINAVEAFEMVFAFDNESFVRDRGFSVTANLFTRRSLFDKVGPFVKSQVSEDVEWCQRASSLGYQLGYCCEAVVEHPARPTWADVCKKTRRMEVEMFNLRVNSQSRRLRWVFRLVAYPFSAMAHTPRVLSSPSLKGFKQRLGALTVLYRLRLFRASVGFSLLVSEHPA
jgi:hypothetical protein